MNTADIRNTDRGQGYFWAIAVPVTLGIVFAAVLLAYHGDKLYDAFWQAVHKLAERRSATSTKILQPEGKRSWMPMPSLRSRPWKVKR
jgi:hypothetical protein